MLSGLFLLAGCPRGAGPRNATASPTACDEGDLAACYELGRRYAARSTDAQALDRARGYFKTACHGAMARACVELRKIEQARCSGGVPEGCYNLGEMYRLGNSAFKRSPARARSYHKAACSEGVADACFKLGVMWQDGKGGAADRDRAGYYLQEACRAKHAAACRMLGASPGSPSPPTRPRGQTP